MHQITYDNKVHEARQAQHVCINDDSSFEVYGRGFGTHTQFSVYYKRYVHLYIHIQAHAIYNLVVYRGD